LSSPPDGRPPAGLRKLSSWRIAAARAAEPALGRIGRETRTGTGRLRTHLMTSRAFVSGRRRDLRFRLIPYNARALVNAGALLLTALLAVFFVLDPLLVPWQHALPRGVVHFFGHVTRFGKSDWILVTTGIFVIAMMLLDASALRLRHRARRTMRSLAALYVFAAVAISGIVSNILKYLIGRARPEHFTTNGDFSFDFFSDDASWAGFPSGHSTTAFALGVALALLFPRWRPLFLILAFWIAVSRLFVRAHYPSDICAGAMLGAFTAWILARALARQRLLFGFDAGGNLVRRRGASGRLL
jgi:undecaprenyl-diphosphatase